MITVAQLVAYANEMGLDHNDVCIAMDTGTDKNMVTDIVELSYDTTMLGVVGGRNPVNFILLKPED